MRYIISVLLTSTAAFAEVPMVVTDIPPVHSIAAAVMEGLGRPVLLLEKGASEHYYQLKPSQAGSIAEADLVVWIGPQLTPWLDAALANRPEDAAVLGLLDANGTYRQDYGTTGGPDHKDHATEDAHDHAGTDPHAWLDPSNAKLWAGLIAAELSRLDPENATTYAANAVKAAAAIDAADAQAAVLLAPVKDRPFMAFHDAYGYFASHFGLTIAGTVALGDAASPGAQHLAALRDMVEGGGVDCLFPELQHDPALMTQLADGSDIAVGAALDPAGANLEPGVGLYPALLLTLAQTIAACTP